MGKKRIISLILSSVLAVTVGGALFSCADGNAPASSAKLNVGDDVRVLDGVECDYENAFFDDFTGGVDYDSWYIGKQAWGAGGNGGVLPENVGYTDDGVLVLTGTGGYYTRGDKRGIGPVKDGTLTGAALISKFKTGSGRYEIKMKALPRLGACTAFWTYAFDDDTRGNHEIDIELPGGKESGVIGFDNVLNTNYWKETQNQSQDVDIDKVTDYAVTAVNDGKWHTFGFDWYSVEPGEDGSSFDLNERDEETGRVIYYIDGKITAISDRTVPFYQSRLWLGVWFPNTTGFVGDALFEKDYMYVDYVSYIPFKNTPVKEFTPKVNGYADADEYPVAPISTEKVNKIANGDFEFAERSAVNDGWERGEAYYSASDEAAAGAEFDALYAANKAEYDELAAELLYYEFAEDHRNLSPAELDAAYAEYAARDDYPSEMSYALRKLKNRFIYPEIPPCYVEEDIGYRGSCGARIEDCGMIRHTVDSVYAGYAVNVSCRAKGKGALTIRFLQSVTGTPIETRTISIDSDEFMTYTAELTAPQNARYVQVQFTTMYRESLIVDNVTAEVN